MNRARNTCSSQCGALRRFVIRKSTSKLRNQAHAPQSAAAARTLFLLPTISLACFLQNHVRSGTDSRWRPGFLAFQFRLNTLIPIGCGKIVDCKKGSRAYPVGSAWLNALRSGSKRAELLE